MGIAAVLAVALLASVWYFRDSLPLLSSWGRTEPALGTATVVEADTPLFQATARDSKASALLTPGEKVELLTTPEKSPAGQPAWVRVRTSSGARGFVDPLKLANWMGYSDQAGYRILQYELHPLNSGTELLKVDTTRIEAFQKRFAGTPLGVRSMLELADRCLRISESLGAQDGSVGLAEASQWSERAVHAYQQAQQSADPDQQQLARQGLERTQALMVTLDARLNPPPAATLGVDRPSVVRGSPVTLTWSSENALRLTLEPGLGTVASSGSQIVYPSGSTTYRLLAEGKRGQAEAQAIVEVTAPLPRVSLSVSPSTVQRGQAVTVNWASENAADLTLVPDQGRVARSGSVQVHPNRSQTFVLLANGEGGSTQAQATVIVTEPAPIRSSIPTQTRTVMIPANTEVRVRLVDSLNSGRASAGQIFRATLDEPVVVDGRTIVAKFADISGRVVHVNSSGRVSGVASLSLELFQIRIGNSSYPLHTEPLPLSAKSERGKDAAKIGIAAGIGAALGAITGGGKGAATGTAAGAGAGTGLVLATKGKELQLDSETPLSFRLLQTVTVQPTR